MDVNHSLKQVYKMNMQTISHLLTITDAPCCPTMLAFGISQIEESGYRYSARQVAHGGIRFLNLCNRVYASKQLRES